MAVAVLLAGLVCNFLLGLVLIGPFGIEGVVASTLVAHAIVLTGVLVLCNRHGLKIDSGVLVIGVALLAICFGKLIACLSFAVLVYIAVFTPVLFADLPKQIAIDKLRSLRSSLFGTIS